MLKTRHLLLLKRRQWHRSWTAFSIRFNRMLITANEAWWAYFKLFLIDGSSFFEASIVLIRFGFFSNHNRVPVSRRWLSRWLVVHSYRGELVLLRAVLWFCNLFMSGILKMATTRMMAKVEQLVITSKSFFSKTDLKNILWHFREASWMGRIPAQTQRDVHRL